MTSTESIANLLSSDRTATTVARALSGAAAADFAALLPPTAALALALSHTAGQELDFEDEVVLAAGSESRLGKGSAGGALLKHQVYYAALLVLQVDARADGFSTAVHSRRGELPG